MYYCVIVVAKLISLYKGYLVPVYHYSWKRVLFFFLSPGFRVNSSQNESLEYHVARKRQLGVVVVHAWQELISSWSLYLD